MTIATPIGPALSLDLSRDAVVACRWVSRRAACGASTGRDAAALAREVRRQLDAYFARRLAVFDLPLHLEGTPFELEVWRAVATIPFGTFVPYGEVARAIDRPGAHRGVARAMGNAPLDLLIPAHRIVGADGRVKGAAPGSMRLKLVAFERGAVAGARRRGAATAKDRA